MKHKSIIIICSILIIEFTLTFLVSTENIVLSQLKFSVTYTIGFLFFVFLICFLIEGVLFLFTSKFSWHRFSIIALILYIIVKISFVYNDTTHKQISEKENLVKLFKEFTNDFVSQRKEYNLKADSIVEVDYNGLTFVKSFEKLYLIKYNISKQRTIDFWNYRKIAELYNKWDTIFQESFKNAISKDVRNFYVLYHNNNFADNANVKNLIKIETEFLDSYDLFIDFLIDNNDNIILKNNKLEMTTQKLIDEYVTLINNHTANEEKYISFLKSYKEEYMTKIKALNEPLQIEEVNEALKLVE